MRSGWARAGTVAAVTVVAAAVTTGAYWLGWASVSTGDARAAQTAAPSASSGTSDPEPGPGTGSGPGAGVPTSVPPTTFTVPPTLHEEEPLATPANPDELALGVAESWLRARLASTWQDPSPSAWVDKVAPFVTPELLATHSESVAGAPAPGPAWSSFVSQQCTANATAVQAGIPAEAPADEGLRYVELTATVATTCMKGVAPPDWMYGARLELRHTGESGWLVSAQLD